MRRALSSVILFVLFLHPGLEAAKIRVVTSIFPVADMVRNILKNGEDTAFLIRRGQDPHTFSVTPRTIREFGEADICVAVGSNFDGWIMEALRSSQNREVRVINLCREMKCEDRDPHIWMSPKRALKIIEVLKNGLIGMYPERTEIILKNYLNYYRELQNLDKHIQRELSGLTNRKFVASHSALSCFAEDYGLVQLDVIMDHHGVEPSPHKVASLIGRIREHRIASVISTGEADSALARRIAQEAKVRLMNIEVLGSPDSRDINSYVRLMRYNIRRIKEAME